MSPLGRHRPAWLVADDAYWVTNADDHSVSRISPKTRAVVQTIGVGSSPSGITEGGGDVWVTNSLDGTVSRIDAETNTEVQTNRRRQLPARDRVRERSDLGREYRATTRSRRSTPTAASH